MEQEHIIQFKNVNKVVIIAFQLKSLKKINLNIYPNPSNGLINIELDFLKPFCLDISITNILGEIVFVDEKHQKKSI